MLCCPPRNGEATQCRPQPPSDHGTWGDHPPLPSKLKFDISGEGALAADELDAEIIFQRESSQRDLDDVAVGLRTGAPLCRGDQPPGDPSGYTGVLGTAEQAGFPRLLQRRADTRC